MFLIFDAEACTFHYEINNHFVDAHVRFIVLDDFFAVDFGNRIDISWKI